MHGLQNIIKKQELYLHNKLFAFYCASYFFVESSFAISFCFYVLIIPSLMNLVYKNRYLFRKNKLHSSIHSLVVFFILILTLSFFNESSFYGVFRTIINILSTGFFLSSAIIFFNTTYRNDIPAYLKIISVIGCIGASYSLLLYFSSFSGALERLVPFGRADHPILGAFTYNMTVFCGLYYTLNQGKNKSLWLFGGYIAILFPAITMIILTQSRMAIMCLLIGIIFITKKNYSRKIATIIIPILVFITSYLLFDRTYILQDYIQTAIERGTSYRIELWKATLSEIVKKPWIGHGMDANITHLQTGSPHNIYLGVAFHSGLLAFVMFIVFLYKIVMLCYQSQKEKWGSLLFAVLLNSLCAGITEFSEIVKGPGPFWVIFWLPICIVLGICTYTKKMT